MTIITREELLKIAEMSKLFLDESEVEPLKKQIQGVLTYAERVREVGQDIGDISNKNINVFREDLISSTDPEPIRALAPEREDDYFVVPRILEK